jgi:hypothetical protein
LSYARVSPLASAATSSGSGAFAVQLVVPVQGGLVGWCMTYQTPNRSGGKCPVVPTSSRPIVTESWSYAPHPNITEAVALTTGAVSAVSPPGGGASVPTRAQAGLPYGLRAAFVEIPGDEPPGEHRTLTPLAAGGQPIAGLPPTSTPPGYGLQSRSWQRPAHPPRGQCGLSASSLPGLTAESGRVVTRLAPVTGLIGRPFLSCADTEYELGSSPLDAGVVLDATHPGTAPAPLPGMTGLRGHAGVFQAPGWNGRITARRIRGAWLVVEGSGSPAQRLAVLEHLHASVHA